MPAGAGNVLCESTPDLIDEELCVPDDHLLVEDAHALGRDNGGQVVEEVLKVRVVLVIRLATVHTGDRTRGSKIVFNKKKNPVLDLDLDSKN
jgi:hypothetical protein